jgi:hypothetical protein
MNPLLLAGFLYFSPVQEAPKVTYDLNLDGKVDYEVTLDEDDNIIHKVDRDYDGTYNFIVYNGTKKKATKEEVHPKINVDGQLYFKGKDEQHAIIIAATPYMRAIYKKKN